MPTPISGSTPPISTGTPVSGAGSTAEGSGTPPNNTASAPGTTVAPGLAPTAPASVNEDGVTRLQTLIAADKLKGEKIVDLFTEPTSRTSTSVTYRFNRVVKPGESIYLMVPAELRERPVNFIVLAHRQDSSLDTDADKTDEWDDTPGLSSVQVHALGLPEGEAWRYWGGSASGSQGAKFAEVSYSPEIENLYEWTKLGHHGTDSGDFSKAPIFADALRLRSLGQDPVQVSEITLKVAPRAPDSTLEAVFCAGTVIGDPVTGAGRKYGGGQGFQGKFPGALELSGYGTGGAGAAALPAGWAFTNGRLEIALPPGKLVTSVEIAGGDSHPDEITNKDGGWGTKGWSKLSIGLAKAGGTTDWFMSSENVPPEGVLGGSPVDGNYVTQPGDKIIVRASSDTTYVMAARVGLLSSAPPEPPPVIEPIHLELTDAVDKGTWKRFGPFEAAADTKVRVRLEGESGNADLYLRRDKQPTTRTYDARSVEAGTEELAELNLLAGEKLFIGVRGKGPGSNAFQIKVEEIA